MGEREQESGMRGERGAAAHRKEEKKRGEMRVGALRGKVGSEGESKETTGGEGEGRRWGGERGEGKT